MFISAKFMGGGITSLSPLLLTVLHPPLSCDHSVIFQRLVPRKEEGLSKKIPPWDATVLLLSSVAYRSERGVIKCPLHFLQEALYNPPSLLYFCYVYPLRRTIGRRRDWDIKRQMPILSGGHQSLSVINLRLEYLLRVT